MDYDREAAVYVAKLAKETKRYSDMAKEMKKLAETVDELTPDERNLLRVAYDEKISPHKASWRTLWLKLEKETDMKKAYRIREYLNKVEADISNICEEVVTLTEDRLLPTAKVKDPTSSTFYYMIIGDFYRYLAEFKNGDEKEKAVEAATEAYHSGMIISKSGLPPIHPLRLNVVLNCSVFYYEILRFAEEDRITAGDAYNEAFHAVDSLDILNEEARKKSKELMALLRDIMERVEN